MQFYNSLTTVYDAMYILFMDPGYSINFQIEHYVSDASETSCLI